METYIFVDDKGVIISIYKRGEDVSFVSPVKGKEFLALKDKEYKINHKAIIDEENHTVIDYGEYVEPIPIVRKTSLEDYLLDLDFRLSTLELGL